MILDEETVVNLYRNENLSVMHIAGIFSVSWYQIEKILRKNKISKRSIPDAITSHNITKYGLKKFLPRKYLSQKDELLKVAGVMLYSGEGTKRRGTVALSNSNPDIIKVFMKFLHRICGVQKDRIHATIHMYEDHTYSELIKFWSGVTQIPYTQFYKPYLHIRKKGTYRSLSKYGTISIQYSDKKLHTLILTWIDEYHKSLIQKGYDNYF